MSRSSILDPHQTTSSSNPAERQTREDTGTCELNLSFRLISCPYLSFTRLLASSPYLSHHSNGSTMPVALYANPSTEISSSPQHPPCLRLHLPSIPSSLKFQATSILHSTPQTPTRQASNSLPPLGYRPGLIGYSRPTVVREYVASHPGIFLLTVPFSPTFTQTPAAQLRTTLPPPLQLYESAAYITDHHL